MEYHPPGQRYRSSLLTIFQPERGAALLRWELCKAVRSFDQSSPYRQPGNGNSSGETTPHKIFCLPSSGGPVRRRRQPFAVSPSRGYLRRPRAPPKSNVVKIEIIRAATFLGSLPPRPPLPLWYLTRTILNVRSR